MEVISGLTIFGQSLTLDDKHFKDCTLRGCQLVYSGGGIIFERTSIIQCSHLFQGPAQATLLYLQNLKLIDTNMNQWTELSADAVH